MTHQNTNLSYFLGSEYFVAAGQQGFGSQVIWQPTAEPSDFGRLGPRSEKVILCPGLGSGTAGLWAKGIVTRQGPRRGQTIADTILF